MLNAGRCCFARSHHRTLRHNFLHHLPIMQSGIQHANPLVELTDQGRHGVHIAGKPPTSRSGSKKRAKRAGGAGRVLRVSYFARTGTTFIGRGGPRRLDLPRRCGRK